MGVGVSLFDSLSAVLIFEYSNSLFLSLMFSGIWGSGIVHVVIFSGPKFSKKAWF